MGVRPNSSRNMGIAIIPISTVPRGERHAMNFPMKGAKRHDPKGKEEKINPLTAVEIPAVTIAVGKKAGMMVMRVHCTSNTP
jgi:hypothetical protein